MYRQSWNYAIGIGGKWYDFLYGPQNHLKVIELDTDSLFIIRSMRISSNLKGATFQMYVDGKFMCGDMACAAFNQLETLPTTIRAQHRICFVFNFPKLRWFRGTVFNCILHGIKEYAKTS